MDQTNTLAVLTSVMHARRSVRAYANDVIDRATVGALLSAAVQAPTAMHVEPWRFVVVQDHSVLRQVSDQAKNLLTHATQGLHTVRGAQSPFSQPDFNVFYDAGTLIVICAPASGHFVQADCWLAAQNLMLVAQAMGLGTCVIGSAVSALNLPDVKQALGIPAVMEAVAPIIVGKPRVDAAQSPRQAPHILAWLDAQPLRPSALA
jgi:nitroreductase